MQGARLSASFSMTIRDRIRWLGEFLVDLLRCGCEGRRMITVRDKKIAQLEKTIRAQATIISTFRKSHHANPPHS